MKSGSGFDFRGALLIRAARIFTAPSKAKAKARGHCTKEILDAPVGLGAAGLIPAHLPFGLTRQ